MGTKIGILLVGAISLTSVCISLLVYQKSLESTEQQLIRTGILTANILADRNSNFLMENDSWEMYESVRNVTSKKIGAESGNLIMVEYAAIIDKNGLVAAHSHPDRYPLLAAFDPGGTRIPPGTEGNSTVTFRETGIPLGVFNISVPVEVRGERLGTVVIGISNKSLIRLASVLRAEIILFNIILIPVAVVIANILAFMLLRPMRQTVHLIQELPPSVTRGISFNKGGIRDEIKIFSAGLQTILERYEHTVSDLNIEKEKLDGILNGIHAAMMVLDIQNNVVWQNRIFSQWFGAYEGCKCYNGTGPNICCECPAKDVFDNEAIVTKKIWKKKLTGKTHVYNTTAAPLHAEGRLVGALVLLLDVTEQTIMEEKLRRNEQLAVLGHMSASLAHEIRNPLNALLMAFKLVTKHEKKISAAEQAKLLEVISKETERLNTVLTDFLSLAHKRELQTKPCDINMLINEVLDLACVMAGNNGNKIMINRELEDGLPPVMADHNTLKQVMWNVSLNGIDAMRNTGGTLTVSSESKNGDVLIKISDTGVGMDKDTEQHCFDPFFSRKDGGTGLGLAVVKHLVSEHDGAIAVNSSPGKGTEFLITIPRE